MELLCRILKSYEANSPLFWDQLHKIVKTYKTRISKRKAVRVELLQVKIMSMTKVLMTVIVIMQ